VFARDLALTEHSYQSFFVQSPPTPVQHSFAHHSSFEIDNMDSQLMGHYHLQEKGWTNCWGVGRHLLGSQIFDYWSGAIYLHPNFMIRADSKL
jgi:hypothetical protein